MLLDAQSMEAEGAVAARLGAPQGSARARSFPGRPVEILVYTEHRRCSDTGAVCQPILEKAKNAGLLAC